jgi:hypothetical protein
MRALILLALSLPPFGRHADAGPARPQPRLRLSRRPEPYADTYYTSRARSYSGTDAHLVRTQQRARRLANNANKLATGHWQHHIHNAVPA